MDLVVDANILFSAAITDSKTSELLLRDDLSLYAPEYLFEEFEKYEDTLLEKTHREPDDFDRFVRILKRHITLVPKEEFKDELDEARSFCPDTGDVPYLGLALYLNAPVWTDDKELRQQDRVDVLTTSELIDSI